MYYDKQGRQIDLMDWVRKFQSPSYRWICSDRLPGCLVSTIWLGLDHGWRGDERPVIFETCVLSDYDEDLNSAQMRYHNEIEARIGHCEILSAVRGVAIMHWKVRQYRGKPYETLRTAARRRLREMQARGPAGDLETHLHSRPFHVESEIALVENDLILAGE